MRWGCDAPDPEVLSDGLDGMPGRQWAAAAYWQRLRPHLNRFGISRVADITGLDVLGFPVAQAVRPGARSNAVTQGKAATLEGAAVGAVLECLEMAAGEAPERLPAGAPEGGWSALAPGAEWAPTDFVAAWELGEDRRGAVPRDLVSTDFTRGARAEAAPILRHSVGLGAGASLPEAMLHGLLECIEADARLRSEAEGRGQRIDPDAGCLVAALEARGMRAVVHLLSQAHGVAVVRASVMEAPGATGLPLPAVGYAARLSVAAAAEAALAEAVQARLAVISGAREDITQRAYAHGHDAETLAAEWARHGAEHGAGQGAAVPDGTPLPSLQDLARRVGPVYAVALHWAPAVPLAIVRIVVPGLLADPLRLGAGR